MAYWNGSNWAVIATGNEGATLQMIGGVPTWVGGIDTTTPPKIGDLYGGGVVFYIAPTPTDLDGDGDLDTGLVCSTKNQGKKQWSNSSSILTDATRPGIGEGGLNTRDIISVQGAPLSDYAAGIASTYAGGGFTDWFLPSMNELKEMFDHKADIDDESSEPLKPNVYYWSSSEFQYSSAYTYKKNPGDFLAQGKNLTYWVRAIRAF
jgi:hypothetical protein